MSPNQPIADAFTLLSKLLDINGENSFKSKSYASAAFAIEKLTVSLAETPYDKIQYIKGIGPSSAQKIIEFLETGTMTVLEDIISQTPSGIIEMLRIKGLGPKKINTIWKEMELESIGELLYACKENRLKLFKGFGEKTQQNVMEAIEFYQRHQGSFLFAEANEYAHQMLIMLKDSFPNEQISIVGNVARQLETTEDIEFLLTCNISFLQQTIAVWQGFEIISEKDNSLVLSAPVGIKIHLHCSHTHSFTKEKIKRSSSPVFWNTLEENYSLPDHVDSEESFLTISVLPISPLVCVKIPKSSLKQVSARFLY